MIWAAVLALAAISFGLKALGPVVLARRELPPRLLETLALLPVPMLAALVVVGTVGADGAVTADARIPAVALAGVLVMRRAPFLAVIVAAAATAALVRAL